MKQLNERILPNIFIDYEPEISKGSNLQDELVIVVHGWISGQDTVAKLANYIHSKGYSVARLDISSTFNSFKRIEGDLLRQMDILNNGKDFKKIHFVAHSMGGLMTKTILAKRIFKNAGVFISLGVPWKGSPIVENIRDTGDVLSKILIFSDFVARHKKYIYDVSQMKIKSLIDVGLVAGKKPYRKDEVFTEKEYEMRQYSFQYGKIPNDGTVSIESALGLKSAFIKDTIVLNINHNGLVNKPSAFKAVLSFLKKSKF